MYKHMGVEGPKPVYKDRSMPRHPRRTTTIKQPWLLTLQIKPHRIAKELAQRVALLLATNSLFTEDGSYVDVDYFV